MSEERRFDWGPPVQSGDSLKEWLIYLVIIVVLTIGIWLLLDINSKKKPVKSSKKSEIIVAVDDKVENVIPKEKNTKENTELSQTKNNIITVQPSPVATSLPQNEFFVQIGAFSDETSANEIYTLLKKESIDATLLKPDEQFEIYRLVVGPYPTEEEAEHKAEQLNEIGFPCFVVEAQ